MAGISIVTMKVMEDNAGNDAFLKWTASVNQAALQIQNNINNSSRCTEMLVGELVDPAAWPSQSPTARICGDQASGAGTCSNALRIRKGTGFEVLLQADTEYAEGFYIPPYGIQLATSPNGSSIAELILTFKTRNRNMRQNDPTVKATSAAGRSGQVIKRIPFIVEKDTTTGRVKSCGQVVSDADVAAKEQLCKQLGIAATWNSVTKTCTLNSSQFNCPAGEIPSQLSSLGKVVCVAANSVANLNEFFDFSAATCSPGQSVTLGPGADGKIKAVCTGTATGCSSQTMSWTNTIPNGGASCTASIVGEPWGMTQTINDTVGPQTGSASFYCDLGRRAWVKSGTPTCIDTGKACAAQIVRWSGTTKFCEASAGAMNHGATATVNDPATTGYPDDHANVECSNGKNQCDRTTHGLRLILLWILSIYRLQ